MNIKGSAPAFVLFILSPLIAELLIGSLPLSNFPELFEVVCLYGAGALSVRETVRRLKLGWPSVIGLGLAFGVIEEALSFTNYF